MATYGSFSEWPRASISLLGWELIKCINHSRGPFRNTCWDECRWQQQVLFFTLQGKNGFHSAAASYIIYYKVHIC